MKAFAVLLYIAATSFLVYGVFVLVDSTGKWASADYALISMAFAVLGGFCAGTKGNTNGKGS